MKKFKITYPRGIIQEKLLISHSLYIEKIKPLNEELHELKLNKGKDRTLKMKTRIDEINEILSHYSNFCTDKSPLGIAVETGLLELWDGSFVSVKIEKI